ncbi:hypothetical protein BDV28DRAFT_27638 [Aspergillus coremiiformis]|uniref:Uncharacterized protein n=1 Tax=Aspergillus coremiiformis TaxID=138285 RepID=A0A5N6ZED9_9EURO|nr:hypothetical protein BDV28DRAFT_27638 [Aspergillus coremiiformis]
MKDQTPNPNKPDAHTTPPPPTYTPKNLIQNQTTDNAYRPSAILPKPIVIPQTAHTYHGTIYRPFMRAYAPALEKHGIGKSDFLAFVDGLNEVWLANPYLQALGATGTLVGFVPLGLPFQVAGLGVRVAAEYGSVKVSQVRTQAYMRMANEELFRPRGLRVQVLKTRGMMAAVGVPGEVLELVGREEEVGEEREREDPQTRRMEAVREFVLPVVVVEEEKEKKGGSGVKENWIQRAADQQEKWLTEKQNQLLVGKREKAGRWMREAEEAEREWNAKIEEVERAKEAVRARARARLEGPLGESAAGRGIVQEDLEKDLKQWDRTLQKLIKEREKKVTKMMQKGERQLQQVETKESRIAQKVMWVVVTADDGSGFQNHLLEDSDH